VHVTEDALQNAKGYAAVTMRVRVDLVVRRLRALSTTRAACVQLLIRGASLLQLREHGFDLHRVIGHDALDALALHRLRHIADE